MSKNIIDPNELIELLTEWDGSYCLKQNHGSITLVEMKKNYQESDLNSFQRLLDSLAQHLTYYKFLSLTYDINSFQVKLTAAVRKENIHEFLRFKDRLSAFQQQWEKIGGMNE